MMDNTTNQKALSPPELWDQLAITQIEKQLAPTGYKKIMNGKHEVSNIQFLPKERVHTCQIMAANMIRLFRENLKDYLEDELRKATENNTAAVKALEDCKIFELGAKESMKALISKTGAQIDIFNDLLKTLITIKPSAPKSQKRPKMEVNGKPKIEIVKG